MFSYFLDTIFCLAWYLDIELNVVRPDKISQDPRLITTDSHQHYTEEVDNFKMFCNPCSRRDVESKSTSWCSDCEEGLCSKCLEDHRVIKLTKSHHVVDMKERISLEHYKLLSIPNCEIHEELRQDMVCKDHDLICCHQCFQSSHKSCKNVSHLDMAAKGIKQSDWLKKLDHDLKEMTKVSQKILEERKISKEEMKSQEKKIKKEIANMKSKFIQHIDDLEKDLLNELLAVHKDGEEESEKEKQELMSMEKEVQADQTALEFVTNNGSESQLFSFVQQQAKKQTEREMRLQKITPSSKVQIELKEASHHIDAIKALGYLSVKYEKVTNPLIAKAMIRSDEHLSGSIEKDFLNLQLEKEVQINPKDFLNLQLEKKVHINAADFLEENERVDDMSLEVQCATVTDDNYILVAGMLRLVVNEKYKTVLHVVKYDEFMNYLLSFRFYSVDKFTNSCKIFGLTPIQNSDKVVIVYCIDDYNKNKLIICCYKAKFDKIVSVNIDSVSHHSYGVQVGSHGKRIYLRYTKKNNGPFYISVYDVLGCCIQEIMDIKQNIDTFIVHPNNTFLVLKYGTFFIVKEDGTEIMSYSPDGLRAVTYDYHGHLFIVMADGIQVMHRKKECICLAYLEKFENSFIGFYSFNKNTTRLLLLTAITSKNKNSKKFGKEQFPVPRNAYSVKILSEAQRNH